MLSINNLTSRQLSLFKTNLISPTIKLNLTIWNRRRENSPRRSLRRILFQMTTSQPSICLLCPQQCLRTSCKTPTTSKAAYLLVMPCSRLSTASYHQRYSKRLSIRLFCPLSRINSIGLEDCLQAFSRRAQSWGNLPPLRKDSKFCLVASKIRFYLNNRVSTKEHLQPTSKAWK